MLQARYTNYPFLCLNDKKMETLPGMWVDFMVQSFDLSLKESSFGCDNSKKATTKSSQQSQHLENVSFFLT